MATAQQIADRLAPVLGLLPSALIRQLRAQRIARQLPAGEKGGGIGSAHFGDRHLASVLLGLAGLKPSDAPEAAALLRSLPFRYMRNNEADMLAPHPTLIDQVIELISSSKPIPSMQLSLCMSPRQAIVTVGANGSRQACAFYGFDGGDAYRAMQRLTVLSDEVFVAAAELLADSKSRRPDMARVPEAAHPSGRIPGSAAPKRTDRSGSPNPQAAFRTSPGASVNKAPVSKERQAFRSRPGSGSTV